MTQTFRFFITFFLLIACLTACQAIAPEKIQIPSEVPVTPSETPASPTTAPTETLVPSNTPTEEITPDETNNTWLKKYGGLASDTVHDVLQAEDKGFYILGETNMKWEPVQEADTYLIRTDAYGEVIWETSYPGEPYKSGDSMFFTEDGNILIAGTIYSDDETRMDIYLQMVDRDGNELKSMTIGGEMDEWVKSIQQTSDGGIVLFGNIVDPNDFVTDPGVAGYGGFEHRSSILAIKLDSLWEEIWISDLDNGKNVLSLGGIQTPDGGFYVLSSILNFPEMANDLYLIRLDQNGQEIWSKTWDDGGISARNFQLASNGNFLMGGLYSESGDPRQGDADFLLMEIDLEGNVVWQTIFGTPDVVDYLSGLAETQDGGYLIVGERTQNFYHSNSELLLIKLDEQREILWEKTLDQKPHYMISTFLNLDEGCLVATSFTYYGDTFDIMLIKTDIDGNVSE